MNCKIGYSTHQAKIYFFFFCVKIFRLKAKPGTIILLLLKLWFALSTVHPDNRAFKLIGTICYQLTRIRNCPSHCSLLCCEAHVLMAAIVTSALSHRNHKLQSLLRTRSHALCSRLQQYSMHQTKCNTRTGHAPGRRLRPLCRVFPFAASNFDSFFGALSNGRGKGLSTLSCSSRRSVRISAYTRWFKYDRDKLLLVYTQIVPVIFEPPCNGAAGIRRNSGKFDIGDLYENLSRNYKFG